MAVDRKTLHYLKLYNILIWVVRYYLAISWLAYGSIKIARLQFPPLSPDVLLQTYGNSTPKDLAWTFMGYSAGYNYFLGVTEIIVGMLLIFRRTSVLGNIIAFGILANVMAFNYSFDVNVKLVATVLMTMTLFLMSEDVGRLINFFLLNKAVTPVEDKQPYFKDKWRNTTVRVTKYAFIIFILFFDIRGYFARARQFDGQRKKPPLFGIYRVTTFIRNKDTLKPLPTDTNCWSKLIITVPEGTACIVPVNGRLEYFALQLDTAQKKMSLSAKTDTDDHYVFLYRHPKDNSLLLKGKWRNDSLEISLRAYDMNKLPLFNRKFRWIIDHNAGYKN